MRIDRQNLTIHCYQGSKAILPFIRSAKRGPCNWAFHWKQSGHFDWKPFIIFWGWKANHSICACAFMSTALFFLTNNNHRPLYYEELLPSSLELTLCLKQLNYQLHCFYIGKYSAGSVLLWGIKWCVKQHGLTNAGGHGSAPHLGVLARWGLLALQTESRGAEKLTARVEVGAVRTLVAAVSRHVQFGATDLCQRKKLSVTEWFAPLSKLMSSAT